MLDIHTYFLTNENVKLPSLFLISEKEINKQDPQQLKYFAYHSPFP